VAFVRQLTALVAGRLAADRDTCVLPCHRVSVRSAAPVSVQIDGDPFGTTPLDVREGGADLRLIVPPRYAGA
jgi:diacylglycerol kinase family enzyme